MVPLFIAQTLFQPTPQANAPPKTSTDSSLKPPSKIRPLVIKDDGKKARSSGSGGGVAVVKVHPKSSNKSVRRVGLAEDEDTSIASLTWTMEEKKNHHQVNAGADYV